MKRAEGKEIVGDMETGYVNIHGKRYETVALRVKRFRETTEYKHYGIITEIIQRDTVVAVVRCAISDATGRVVSTGHSEEYRTDSGVNSTSALENAETSAIGRALAAFGMGGTEFASADEMTSALTTKGSARDPVIDQSTGEIKLDKKFLFDLEVAAKGGVDEYRKAWESGTPDQRRGCAHLHSGLKLTAQRATERLKGGGDGAETT